MNIALVLWTTTQQNLKTVEADLASLISSEAEISESDNLQIPCVAYRC